MSELHILEPSDGRCKICAEFHEPEHPHNIQNFYYRIKFINEHNRNPTWRDAIAHCPQEIKDIWLSNLDKLGIDPDSINYMGDITSKKQVEQRLKGNNNASN